MNPHPQQVTWKRPWLYPQQQAAIFSPARYAVIEASTKAGKTIGCLIWLVEEALRRGRRGRRFWWVAPVQAQADIAFARARDGLSADFFTVRAADRELVLPDGTVLEFRSAERPDSLYGEDVYAAVLDEAPRMREEAWHAVRSTLTATRGPVRIIGNVRGRRNWAYQLARRAEAGEEGMSYARLTAYDAVAAGILHEDEVADAQRQLPDAIFRELYLAEPSDDAGNPFGIGAIGRCVDELSDREPAVWGWDLAKSQDWTVGIALDDDGQVCRFERWQDSWNQTTARITAMVGTQTPAWVDSTGVGDALVEQLADAGVRVEPFLFSSHSKQQLMERLAIAIQQQEVLFPAGLVVDELELFEYEITRTGVRYSAPSGLHDDCVCALALAVYGRAHPPMPWGVL